MAALTTIPNSEALAQNEEAYLFPCSVVQRTCWFLDRLSPGSAAMNIAVRFILEGLVEVDKLQQAFQEIVSRHESLRTRFLEHEGEPAALVEAQSHFVLNVVDLQHLPPDAVTAESERLAVAEAQNGFDLTTGPLFRVTLLRTGALTSVLLITLHHIISDGWSVGVVTNELGLTYEGLVEHHDPNVPELEIQYGDYACWQKDWIASGGMGSELAGLKEKLDGFVPISIPTDFERPTSSTGLGEIRSILLPRTLTDQLKQFSDRNGCTLFVTMFSAFALLMSIETAQTDITVRTQTSGRDRVELEALIGWFVNSIILRTDLGNDPSFAEAVLRNRDIVLGALAHQSIPFELMMKEIRPKQSSSRQLPFQVNFIFQRDFVRPWQRGGVRLIPIPSKSAGTFVDLNFFMVEREDGWRLSVDVNKDVFRPETGERFLQRFTGLLEAVAANPEIRRSELVGAPTQPAPSSEVPQTAEISFNNYVPPRNEYEEAIIEIWKKVLNAEVVGAYSNFFDLGGHSLLAVNMLEQLRRRFGHSMQVTELFTDPTPAAMAQVISGEGIYSDNRAIIPIQPEGKQMPLYMIGGDHWFRPLANHIGRDRPFLGVPLLQYRHLDLGTMRAQVAAEVSELLLSQDSSKPFLLGGWCADGLTAFEVARALERSGAKVSGVVLFDAMNPEYYGEVRGLLHSAGRTLHSLNAIVQASSSHGVIASTRTLASTLGTALRRAGKRLVDAQRSAPVDTSVPFPLLVVRPVGGVLEEADLGWQRATRRPVQILEVPGDHSSIFKEPQVKAVGHLLRDALVALTT